MTVGAPVSSTIVPARRLLRGDRVRRVAEHRARHVPGEAVILEDALREDVRLPAHVRHGQRRGPGETGTSVGWSTGARSAASVSVPPAMSRPANIAMHAAKEYRRELDHSTVLIGGSTGRA